MPTQAGAKPLFELGDAAVRVLVVEDAYGYLQFRPVHHRYSIIDGETTTSDRFDPALINELICRLEQTRNFFKQRSVDASASPELERLAKGHLLGRLEVDIEVRLDRKLERAAAILQPRGEVRAVTAGEHQRELLRLVA